MAEEKKPLDERLKQLLNACIDSCDQEDESVRLQQIRTWRKLKLLWEGFSRTWWSATARDWRIYDEQTESNNQSAYYDKPVNVFRAYLESIIAALSVTIPPVTCYPDDADNVLDLQTAKAGDKIAELIYKHNDVSYLWLHALFIFCTEGLVCCYSYPKEDESYGTYEEKEYAEETEHKLMCPQCQAELDEALLQGGPEQEEELEKIALSLTALETDEYMPEDHDAAIQNEILNKHMIVCPNCAVELDPALKRTPLIVERLVGITKKPKTRQCMEVYGGLYVKVSNYAHKQEDLTYLRFAYETHFGNVLEKYPEFKKENKIGPEGLGTGPDSPYEQWGRLNPQYRGIYPRNTVTVNNYWLRPAQFNILQDEEDTAYLKKKFPNGVKVVKVNNSIVDAENESLDDCWTLTRNPLSDYLHHYPLGLLLTSVQDITNEIIALTLQTIEHGISQTFASPALLNFDLYSQLEATPGMIIPVKSSYGKSLNEGFYETKTANLSPEVLPFANKMQELGQLVSGAMPSLFGGSLDGSKTASEYSMSRAQSLQRLQNTWKMFTWWWKCIFGKAIPSYMKNMAEDEKYVTKDAQGNFLNIFIRKAEMQGKIGNIELEANEQLPMTWGQKRDVIMNLLKLNNEDIISAIMSPENLPILKDAIGLNDFIIPGEADRQKQYEEITELLASEPMMIPPDPNAIEAAIAGENVPPEMLQEQEQPSVPIDPDLDNHEIESELCRSYLIGDAGRLTKIENPNGYRNILLHMKAHQEIIKQQQMMAAQQLEAQNQPLKERSNKPKINEDNDVSVET